MKLRLGKSGEERAAGYLRKKGYDILEKNYRCRFGEIDIIASKDGVLVFVEVKTRSSADYGFGYESVTQSKQGKLVKTAQFYMSGRAEVPARFDVISIDGDLVTHIENAF
jgi:putative endonuclease